MASYKKAHQDGRLNQMIQEIMVKINMAGSLFVAMITIPAMPVIYYMTILYNVIMRIVTFFRNL